MALLFPSVEAILSRTAIQAAIPDDRLGWRGNPQYPEHDPLGFRNRSVPKEPVVIAFGDSQTYGVTVSREQAWPQQLEQLGGPTTYNMAFSGWGPTQSVLLLGQALQLKPKLIVEAFYAGNDLVDSFTGVYIRGQLPELKARDSGALRSIAEAEKADPWANKFVNPISLEAGKKDKRPPTNAAEWLARTRLYGLWRAAKRAYTRTANSGDLDDENRSQSDDDHPLFESGPLKTVFAPSYRFVALDLADPRVAEGLRISLESLRLLSERSTAANVGFAVLLVPTKELAFKDAVARGGGQPSPTYQTLIEDEELFWQRTRDYLAAHQIRSIDALPTLRASIERGEQPYGEVADGHPNPLGQRLIAELVKTEVERQGLALR